jgi:beta-glucanase (GH16 family)
MANIAFGNKYFIFSKFSSIPKTAKIEADRANLRKEFEELNTFIGSQDLKDFNELGKYLESKEFKDTAASTESSKKKETDKINSYQSRKKSKPFKDYFKFKDSPKLKQFQAFSSSKELKDFEELEKLVTSKKFEDEKKNFETKKAGEEKKLADFNVLKKSKAIKDYLHHHDSGKNKTGEQSGNSADVKKYLELEKYISSKEHTDALASATKDINNLNEQLSSYLNKKKSKPFRDYFAFGKSQKYQGFVAFEKSKELADYLATEKYLNSDEHKNLLKSIEAKETAEKEKRSKYDNFKNSKKYKWYLAIKDSNKFSEIKKLKLVFEDDFKDGKLDKNKWMTRYYWGDKLINDAYALETDKAFPTDGKNIEIRDSIIKILTRAEKTTGKMWKQPFGFIPQEFGYSTGLISTAKSHRQKYGKIEARIKINYSKPVHHHFWMASEMNLPHVDILKQSGKKTRVDMANLYGNPAGNKGPEKKTAEFSGLDISQDFFIYTLEWTKDKLVWKINEVVVNEQTHGVPQEEMYLVFSSGITGNVSQDQFPASMEIDWVRCYTFL